MITINKEKMICALNEITYFNECLKNSKLSILKRLLLSPRYFFRNSYFHRYLYESFLKNPRVSKIRTFFGEQMYLVPLSNPELWIYGAYINFDPEIRLTKYIIKSLEDKTIFFDLGANIGYYAILVAHIVQNAKIFVFEPDPIALNVLKKNERKNITIIPKAVSNKNTVSVFYSGGILHSDISTLNLSNIVGTAIEKFSLKKIKVETITIDTFCKKNNMIPKIIKIDVEGSEEKVLLGARNLLKKNNIIIILEVWIDTFTSHYKRAIHLLKKSNFVCFSIDDNGDLRALDYSFINYYIKELKLKYQKKNDPSTFDNLVFIKRKNMVVQGANS